MVMPVTIYISFADIYIVSGVSKTSRTKGIAYVDIMSTIIHGVKAILAFINELPTLFMFL